ncbi:thioesterase family protein [Streptomyces sp. HNM0574]|uniref:thioesterase family protein n=1 Tax=Streptomyces sp. HNM0574 TaxID=2714954 RepID=UPI00146C851F|nr:thioesterase family protein [Streptomyces sp. HNM0574]NLU70286.1 thioesterase [Streptomyces sp. HNM0574]
MSDAAPATRLPFFEQTVRPEWIDYNGHMSEAFYVLVFGHATDAMMIETGLDSAYRERTNCSLYTAEAHVRYLDEVSEGAELTVRTRILGVDAKKVRFAHEMYVGTPEESEGPVATTELLGIHVDQGAGRAAPLPEEVRERLAALTEELPEWAGRSIATVPRPRA